MKLGKLSIATLRRAVRRESRVGRGAYHVWYRPGPVQLERFGLVEVDRSCRRFRLSQKFYEIADLP